MSQAAGAASSPYVVRPESRFRLIVGAIAVAVLAVDVVVIAASTANDSRPFPGLTWLAVIAIVALARTAGWSTLREVRVDHADLVLVHADRTERRIAISQIGALGHRGATLAGRLFDGFINRGADAAGRIVVLDANGRVIVSRRAGWMRLDELQRLSAAVGLPWTDAYGAVVPVVPVPRPDRVPVRVVPGLVAIETPATAAPVAQLVRRRRVRLLTYLAPVLVGIALCFLGAWLPEGRQPEGIVFFLGVSSIFIGCVLLVLAPANEHRPRPVLKVLRRSEWSLVELLVTPGVGDDRSKRSVAVFGPERTDGAPTDWFKVSSGGGRGWFQEGTRGWFWLASGATGKRSVVAALDMSDFAVVTSEGTGGRFRAKADDAFRLACEIEHWWPHVGAAVAPVTGAPPAPQAGWGAAPSPIGETWGPPPAWSQPPAWQQPHPPPAPSAAPVDGGPTGWGAPPPSA